MSAPPHSGPDALPLHIYTRFGELNLEGRLLIHCDQRLSAGDPDGALKALLALRPRAPWLQHVCAGRMQQLLEWRYVQAKQPERELVATDGAAAEPDADGVLERVLSQPSDQVVIRGCSPALLLEGLLQQAVWDAAVWLDPQAAPSGSLPVTASWLDGVAADRQPAPLRELRLREAERHLLQQGLAWVPRRRPLPLRDADALEACQPADWPRCLHRSMGRRVLQAQLIQSLHGAQPSTELPKPELPNQELPSLSIVLTIDGSDSAEAIRRSLNSLGKARQTALQPTTELLVAHPPLKPAQRTALESARANPALRDLQLLEIPKRSGVAMACNQALAASQGSQLFLVRAGVSLGSGVLPALQQALLDPACRAAQPALLSNDERLVGVGYGFARDGHPGQALLQGLASEVSLPASARVQAVQGSCWLLRRQEVLAVGGWDGQLFNGLEDQDLCLRLVQRFGGHCQVCCRTSATAPLEQGLEAGHSDRDWNRSVFLERWQSRGTADLAELAGAFGQQLVGLLPEANPPRAPQLRGCIGVLAPLPSAATRSAS